MHGLSLIIYPLCVVVILGLALWLVYFLGKFEDKTRAALAQNLLIFLQTSKWNFEKSDQVSKNFLEQFEIQAGLGLKQSEPQFLVSGILELNKIQFEVAFVRIQHHSEFTKTLFEGWIISGVVQEKSTSFVYDFNRHDCKILSYSIASTFGFLFGLCICLLMDIPSTAGFGLILLIASIFLAPLALWVNERGISLTIPRFSRRPQILPSHLVQLFDDLEQSPNISFFRFAVDEARWNLMLMSSRRLCKRRTNNEIPYQEDIEAFESALQSLFKACK